jgi:hypothetical protein
LDDYFFFHFSKPW